MDYLSNSINKPLRTPTGLAQGIPGESMQAAANEARKPSQMEHAVNELGKQHARVDALIGELERRICSVLLAVPPSNPSDDECAPASPLAQKLFEEARTVRFLAER